MQKAAFILTSSLVAGILAGPAAAGITPSAVKTTAANEQNPAASSGWFVWTESPAAHPNRTNVWAEDIGTTPFRVNQTGTRAWSGGIEGDRLVYQEIASGDSDIRLHDLTADQPLADEPINTRRWEWHPSISTDSTGDTWLLFGRQNTSTFAQKILAYNTTDNRTVELQSTSKSRNSLIPGQVNGDWATWTACRPTCQVRYVNLLGGPRSTVPRPNFVRHQYGSSIGEDGRIYYVRSGAGCGANVRIMRWNGSANQLLVDFPDRRDVFFTYVDDQAGNEVYYDRVACGSGAWNIYKVVDP